MATTSLGSACTVTSIPAARGRRGQPVLGVGDHDADDIDAVLAQHIQGRHAEMAGADEGNPHGVWSVMSWAS